MWGNPTLFNLLKKILRKDKYWYNQLKKSSIDLSIYPLTTNNAIYPDSLTLISLSAKMQTQSFILSVIH